MLQIQTKSRQSFKESVNEYHWVYLIIFKLICIIVMDINKLAQQPRMDAGHAVGPVLFRWI